MKGRFRLNWITYFEKYSSDRKLLASIENEIARLEHYGKENDRLPLLRESARELSTSVMNVERFLKDYVEHAESPRDAGKRAQEELFLKLRYDQDLSIEATAEAMGVSRDTAYRIRRRIIDHGSIFSSFN